MTRIIAALGLAAAIVLTPMAAFAVGDFDPAALPHDRASLEKLNDEQLSMLRKAVRYCGDFNRSHHSFNFCVTSNTDLDVRHQGSPALKAFHFTLSPYDRYDDTRSWVSIRRLEKH